MPCLHEPQQEGTDLDATLKGKGKNGGKGFGKFGPVMEQKGMGKQGQKGFGKQQWGKGNWQSGKEQGQGKGKGEGQKGGKQGDQKGYDKGAGKTARRPFYSTCNLCWTYGHSQRECPLEGKGFYVPRRACALWDTGQLNAHTMLEQWRTQRLNRDCTWDETAARRQTEIVTRGMGLST